MGTSLRTVFWDRGPVCYYTTSWWRRAYVLGMLAHEEMTKLAGVDSCQGGNGKSWRCCEWIVRSLVRRSKFISFSVPRIWHIWLHPWTWLHRCQTPLHFKSCWSHRVRLGLRFLIMFPCKYCAERFTALSARGLTQHHRKYQAFLKHEAEVKKQPSL